MHILDAKIYDLESMLEIHNYYVLNTNALPQRESRTLEDQIRWFNKMQKDNMPILVADVDACIVGYCYVDRFSDAKSFDPTIEVHIYINPSYVGKGFGKALLLQIVDRARLLNRRSIVARIDSSNLASINLHKKCGFTVVGKIQDIGFKRNVFVSSTYMQYMFEGNFNFD